LRGVYTLIIRLTRRCVTTAGRRLRVSLGRGLYLYTGSALGCGSASLEGRVGRHLRRVKKEFWHIDRILACRHARVVSVVFARTARKRECTVNAAILHNSNVRVPCRGVGSSDCRCSSHLLAAVGPLRSVEGFVRSSYARAGLHSEILGNSEASRPPRRCSGTYGRLGALVRDGLESSSGILINGDRSDSS